MKRILWLVFSTCAVLAADLPPGGDVFVEKPYLQMGNAPKLAREESVEVLWHTRDEDVAWSVEVRNPKGWKKAHEPHYTRVAVRDVEPHRVYRARIEKLAPGEEFEYRVLKAGTAVFQARARARKSPSQPVRFVLFGDCAQGTPEQRAIAYQTWLAKPDFLLIAGDIVYTKGRITEYRPKFFPAYNADEPSRENGAPLLRSVLSIGAPGNHDIATRDVTTTPDTMAYFYYWSQPLNGPSLPIEDPSSGGLIGAEADRKAFLEAAGKNFPRMANFSFDYGNAHWLILDSNPYVNWREPKLREWVLHDLKSARSTWKFVAFHHPGFNSSVQHYKEQHMRWLSPVFEEGGADIVFSGHVHNYQRTRPLTFVPAGDAPGTGIVDGQFRMDTAFDGIAKTKPNGVLYVISGGGGAKLYSPELEDQPATWKDYTVRHISKVNSFSQVDVDGGTLTLRQVDGDGRELDRFVVTK